MAEPQTTEPTPTNGAAKPAKPEPLLESQNSWGATWRRAEIQAKAKEAADAKALAKSQAAAQKVLDAEQGKTAPAPAEPVEEPAAVDAEPSEEGDETEGDDHNAKVDRLNALAKELGYKLDLRSVSVEERAGFREEKRKWQEKAKARELEHDRKVQAAEQFFSPYGEAAIAMKEGDYDGAIRALAKAVKDEDVSREGLNAATKRYLKRAQGMDPRVDAMERELRELREREAQQTNAHREAQQRAEQERVYEQARTVVREQLSEAEPAWGELLTEFPALAESIRGAVELDDDSPEAVREAIVLAAKQVEQTANLRKLFRALQKFYGHRPPTEAETLDEESAANRSGTASAKPGAQKKPPKALSSQRNAVQASRPDPNPLDAKAWRDKWAKLMEEATE